MNKSIIVTYEDPESDYTFSRKMTIQDETQDTLRVTFNGADAGVMNRDEFVKMSKAFELRDPKE
jgi:outer membrane protein assembly factor BamE (lipoprotein component of BamABCDE complex)